MLPHIYEHTRLRRNCTHGIVLLMVVVVMPVIIAYLAGILIRKRNDSRIAQLEERRQKLFDLPINEEIEEVKKLSLDWTKSNNIP